MLKTRILYAMAGSIAATPAWAHSGDHSHLDAPGLVEHALSHPFHWAAFTGAVIAALALGLFYRSRGRARSRR